MYAAIIPYVDIFNHVHVRVYIAGWLIFVHCILLWWMWSWSCNLIWYWNVIFNISIRLCMETRIGEISYLSITACEIAKCLMTFPLLQLTKQSILSKYQSMFVHLITNVSVTISLEHFFVFYFRCVLLLQPGHYHAVRYIIVVGGEPFSRPTRQKEQTSKVAETGKYIDIFNTPNFRSVHLSMPAR